MVLSLRCASCSSFIFSPLLTPCQEKKSSLIRIPFQRNLIHLAFFSINNSRKKTLQISFVCAMIMDIHFPVAGTSVFLYLSIQARSTLVQTIAFLSSISRFITANFLTHFTSCLWGISSLSFRSLLHFSSHFLDDVVQAFLSGFWLVWIIGPICPYQPKKKSGFKLNRAHHPSVSYEFIFQLFQNFLRNERYHS